MYYTVGGKTSIFLIFTKIGKTTAKMRLLVLQMIKGGPDLMIYESHLLELPVGYDIIVSDKVAHIKSEFFVISEFQIHTK